MLLCTKASVSFSHSCNISALTTPSLWEQTPPALNPDWENKKLLGARYSGGRFNTAKHRTRNAGNTRATLAGRPRGACAYKRQRQTPDSGGACLCGASSRRVGRRPTLCRLVARVLRGCSIPRRTGEGEESAKPPRQRSMHRGAHARRAADCPARMNVATVRRTKRGGSLRGAPSPTHAL